MQTKHTPGPWHFQLVGTPGYYLIRHNSNMGTKNVRIHGDDGLANSRLMAAAPDLLAALEWLVNERSAGTDKGLLPDGLLNATRAAIAKARGEA